VQFGDEGGEVGVIRGSTGGMCLSPLRASGAQAAVLRNHDSVNMRALRHSTNILGKRVKPQKEGGLLCSKTVPSPVRLPVQVCGAHQRHLHCFTMEVLAYVRRTH
jgi:hypothetical protein